MSSCTPAVCGWWRGRIATVMGWEVGGRQSLEGNPGAFFDRLKRLEDRNSDTGACSMHHSTERAALSRATHVPRVAPVTAQEAWSTHPASTPFGLRSHRTCGGRGGARARSTRAVAVTRIGRAQLAVKDGGATLPGHTSPVPSHEPILCGGASPQRGVRPPANTADIRAPAPPRKRRPRGSTQGDLGGGAGATTPTTGGGAASRLPRCPPGQRRRHRASARVQLVLRVAEARPRAGGTRARRAGGGRADTQPVPGRAPAGGRGTYAAVHIPSHLCPAPSRGSTGLAGVFTRPAGLPGCPTRGAPPAAPARQLHGLIYFASSTLVLFTSPTEAGPLLFSRSWGSRGERSRRTHRIRRSRAPDSRIYIYDWASCGRGSCGRSDLSTGFRGVGDAPVFGGRRQNVDDALSAQPRTAPRPVPTARVGHEPSAASQSAVHPAAANSNPAGTRRSRGVPPEPPRPPTKRSARSRLTSARTRLEQHARRGAREPPPSCP